MTRVSRIPKPTKSPSKSSIPTQNAWATKYSDSGLKFSFAALETTEYFNLDGTCQKWASDLFEMLKSVSKTNEAELKRGEYKTYRVHDHEHASPPSALPSGVELKDCYQIRISKSKGGIHGVFFENVFYVIWLDPLHNMYPNDMFGGLRKIKESSTCCKDRDEEILILKEELAKLKKELKSWQELVDQETR